MSLHPHPDQIPLIGLEETWEESPLAVDLGEPEPEEDAERIPCLPWSSELEREVRDKSDLVAKTSRIPPHDREEFVAFCLETLYERAVLGTGLRSINGVMKACSNLAESYWRSRNRKKNSASSLTPECEEIHGCDERTPLMMERETLCRAHPKLAIVIFATEAGLDLETIRRGFDMERTDFMRFLKTGTEGASLL